MRIRLFHVLFFLFGVVFAASGVFNLKSTMDLTGRGDVVEAQISYIEIVERDTDNDDKIDERDFYVHLEYEYMGEVYNEVARNYYDGMDEGDILEIYVDPADPTHFTYKESAYFFPIAAIAVGIACMVYAVCKAFYKGHVE